MDIERFKLDFTGGPDSWFDLWHIHVDFEGEGNNSWETRKGYLQQLKALYDEFLHRLKTYPKEFQIWISIDEEDSSEDAVYIHTINPNDSDFPIAIDYKPPIFINPELKEYLEGWGLQITQVDYLGGKMFYLYEDKGIGITLIK